MILCSTIFNCLYNISSSNIFINLPKIHHINSKFNNDNNKLKTIKRRLHFVYFPICFARPAYPTAVGRLLSAALRIFCPTFSWNQTNYFYGSKSSLLHDETTYCTAWNNRENTTQIWIFFPKILVRKNYYLNNF